VQPVLGLDGSVRFLFGAQDPSLVCAPLHICDVALQQGEEIKFVNIGDPDHWQVEPTYAGTSPLETPHLFIKPADVGLETSLVVSTDRRTYHFRLISHSQKYMPKVTFTFPEDVSAKVALLRMQRKQEQTRQNEERARDTLPETGEYLGNLAFNYRIEGRAPWRPVRVFNDHTETPSLLVLRSEGGLFSEDELVMVNYRLVGRRFVVDCVFDRAVLLAGVGSNQLRVTITRLPPSA
jgi:type IV secretion system protein VirB9